MKAIKTNKTNRKGVFFSLITIMLVIPLIYFITFHISYYEQRVDDVLGRTRCERLYYFVEDVKKDLKRAMVIFGRRAAIYAISEVVTSGNDLENYEFNCSNNCALENCNDLEYNIIGAEAAVVELMVCGTLYGETIPYMENHTFPLWMDKMEQAGEDMHFNMNLTLREINVIPRDAFSFATLSTLRIRIWDESELCFYQGISDDVQSNTSILELEDPLYPLNTQGRVSRYIINCSADLEMDMIAGCSRDNTGNGTKAGNVKLYSDIGGNVPALENYCATTPPDELVKQILVLDGGAIVCNQNIRDCLNISTPSHFGGLIVYNPANSAQVCEASIPWISASGDIDDIPPENPPKETGCGAGNFTITNESCVFIKNVDGCNLHRIILGLDSSLINTSCYEISDVEENYNIYCANHVLNGPSFFDRLDGRLYLSDKYKQQANRTFGNTLIGIESMISPYTLESYSLQVNETNSWIDYLYWSDEIGCEALGICDEEGYAFNLDCPHSHKYQIDTECANASGCCGDGTCNNDEDCGSCPTDCTCLPGCPNTINLMDCKKCGSGPSSSECNVTYTLSVMNATGFMNLTSNPTIHVANETTTDSHIMNEMSGLTGWYNITLGVLNKNDNINATAYVTETSCTTLTNSTPRARINTLADC
ncbi:MAG: hypothetical protein B6U97_04540 [Candidatus Altiarchaeales archaeon ex4484_96]|nr:MAG: hypothetical protein B6U97_04540 [Candidatus Altiarchaeales archaeon ex4484_96]